jgi:hypothetical protein
LDLVHPHWHYDRPKIGTPLEVSTENFILDPVNVRGKGRPKGAMGRKNREAESSK